MTNLAMPGHKVSELKASPDLVGLGLQIFLIYKIFSEIFLVIFLVDQADGEGLLALGVLIYAITFTYHLRNQHLGVKKQFLFLEISLVKSAVERVLALARSRRLAHLAGVQVSSVFS